MGQKKGREQSTGPWRGQWFAPGDGVWTYCVPTWDGGQKPIAHVLSPEEGHAATVNVATDTNLHTLAVGGTIEGLKKFVERVSQNWEV